MGVKFVNDISPSQGLFLLRNPASIPNAVNDAWGLIMQAEPTMPAIQASSTGFHHGDHINLQWWVDQTKTHFAIQVLDKKTLIQWEMFLVPLNGDRKIFGWKTLWQQDHSIENKLIMPLINKMIEHFDVSFAAEHHPSFISILLAGTCESQTKVFTNDGAKLENANADVQYWRDLAKKLTKDNQRFAQLIEEASSHSIQAYQKEDPASPQIPPRQWTLRDMPEWAALNADRIIVLPRAISEAKRSPYSNSDLVYQSLDLLAHEYTLTKTGQLGRTAFKDRADSLALAYGGSVEPSVAGMQSDQYFIRWNGQRRFLDQHLSNGNSRDQRFCLRIYFTWDEDEKKVVVGWLPSHLGNSAS